MSLKVNPKMNLFELIGKLSIVQEGLALIVSCTIPKFLDINGSSAPCHQMICPRSFENYVFENGELVTHTNIINA